VIRLIIFASALSNILKLCFQHAQEHGKRSRGTRGGRLRFASQDISTCVSHFYHISANIKRHSDAFSSHFALRGFRKTLERHCHWKKSLTNDHRYAGAPRHWFKTWRVNIDTMSWNKSCIRWQCCTVKLAHDETDGTLYIAHPLRSFR
jgi:hypothetical protein